ncbi:hypothetical protein RUND412_000217 [Rhizina undulata]
MMDDFDFDSVMNFPDLSEPDFFFAEQTYPVPEEVSFLSLLEDSDFEEKPGTKGKEKDKNKEKGKSAVIRNSNAAGAGAGIGNGNPVNGKLETPHAKKAKTITPAKKKSDAGTRKTLAKMPSKRNSAANSGLQPDGKRAGKAGKSQALKNSSSKTQGKTQGQVKATTTTTTTSPPPQKPTPRVSLTSGSDSESDLIITGFTTNPLKRLPPSLPPGGAILCPRIHISTFEPHKRHIKLPNGKILVRRVVRTGPWSSKEHGDFAEAMQNGTDFRGIAEMMGRKVEDVFAKFSDVVQAALYRGDLRDRATQT